MANDVVMGGEIEWPEKKLVKYLFGVGGLFVILLILVITVKVYAQYQFSADIAERLIQEGVPVKEIKTLNHLPYVIDISLQSSSTDNHLSLDDNWNMQLARREATFSYRFGTRLDSFILNVYNSNNELISSEQQYLYPEDLNQQLDVKSPIVDALTAEDIILNQLQLGELSLDILEVNPDIAIGGSGQVLELSVSARNLETVNKSCRYF